MAGFVKRSVIEISFGFRSVFLIKTYKTLVERSFIRCTSFVIAPIKDHKTVARNEKEISSVILQKYGMGVTPIKNLSEVHPEVARILRDSKPKLVNRNWRKPRISARRLAELRKKYIAMGFFWPEKPMIDRGLDKTPKGHRFEQEKQERLQKIDENMKNMPKIIEDFRNKMRVMRSKRREEKKEARVRSQEARRQGIHPKDPRGLQAAKQGDKATKPKKKFQKKKKD